MCASVVSRAAFVSLLGLLPAAAAVLAGSSPAAEEARWLVHEANWGYLSAINRGPAAGAPAAAARTKMKPSGEVASFSDGAPGASTGRLFFYVMTGDPKTEGGASSIGASDTSFPAALTFSEAIMDPADYSASQCGARKAVDPEDPRCAKITLTGMMQRSGGGDVDIGKEALFARHPQMKVRGYFLVFVQLFEKYGTLIERYTALIEKVSALIRIGPRITASRCSR
eukprot:SAG31_NODE_4653_length_3067_cov_27.573787_1_plen_226_part_00